MAETPDSVIADLRAYSSAGECRNAFFRQSQLKSLHEVLRKNTSSLQEAIQKDLCILSAEAGSEVAIAISTIAEHYDSIDPIRILEEEYRIAKGRDHGERVEPLGIVYIEPDTRHTPFFSIIAPLSAAIAAGNAVALKLENNLRSLPSLLRNLLSQALPGNNFAIVTSSPSANALSACLEVVQIRSADDSPPTRSQLISTTKGMVIAIVDRSADLVSAAKSLVNARFAFGGTSPYAPDIILVNEFIMQEFLDIVLRAAIPYITRSTVESEKEPKFVGKPHDNMAEQLNALGSDPNWQATIITKGANGAVLSLEGLTRKNCAFPSKIAAQVLTMSKITSLDHAIDLVSKSGQLSAAYLFANLGNAKYLAQFIASNVTFVNHIPLRLLLGPTAPIYYVFDLEKRYTTEHFIRSTPVFITPPVDDEQLRNVFQGNRKLMQAQMEKATQELREKKRPESIAIGFFEQGIFIGLGFYGIPILSCIGASLFYGIRFGLRKWAVL